MELRAGFEPATSALATQTFDKLLIEFEHFCGRTPKSVLARHYIDYNPEMLRRIYEEVSFKVLFYCLIDI